MINKKQLSLGLIIIVSTQLHGFDWIIDRLPELNLTGYEEYSNSEDLSISTLPPFLQSTVTPSASLTNANIHSGHNPFDTIYPMESESSNNNHGHTTTSVNDNHQSTLMSPEVPVYLRAHANQILQFVRRHNKFTTPLGLALLAGMTGSAPVWYMAATSAITYPVADLLEQTSQTTILPFMNSATNLTSVVTRRPTQTNHYSDNTRNISPMRRMRPSSPIYHNQNNEPEFNFAPLSSKSKEREKESIRLGGTIIEVVTQANEAITNLGNQTNNLAQNLLPVVQTIFPQPPVDTRTPEQQAQANKKQRKDAAANRKSKNKMFNNIKKTSDNVARTTEHMSNITTRLGKIFAPRRYEKLVSHTGSTFVQSAGCSALMGIGGVLLYKNLINHIDHKSTLFASIGGGMMLGSMLYARLAMQAPTITSPQHNNKCNYDADGNEIGAGLSDQNQH